jgi:hypothetical protein
VAAAHAAQKTAGHWSVHVLGASTVAAGTGCLAAIPEMTDNIPWARVAMTSMGMMLTCVWGGMTYIKLKDRWVRATDPWWNKDVEGVDAVNAHHHH